MNDMKPMIEDTETKTKVCKAKECLQSIDKDVDKDLQIDDTLIDDILNLTPTMKEFVVRRVLELEDRVKELESGELLIDDLIRETKHAIEEIMTQSNTTIDEVLSTQIINILKDSYSKYFDIIYRNY